MVASGEIEIRKRIVAGIETIQLRERNTLQNMLCLGDLMLECVELLPNEFDSRGRSTKTITTVVRMFDKEIQKTCHGDKYSHHYLLLIARVAKKLSEIEREHLVRVAMPFRDVCHYCSVAFEKKKRQCFSDIQKSDRLPKKWQQIQRKHQAKKKADKEKQLEQVKKDSVGHLDHGVRIGSSGVVIDIEDDQGILIPERITSVMMNIQSRIPTDMIIDSWNKAAQRVNKSKTPPLPILK